MKKYLSRQVKIREDHLKYDFLPSMIEIIEHPSNRLGTFILFLIITMIVSAVVWAALFQIDIAVTATGSAMPDGGIVSLTSISGGKIEKVNVDNGDYVKKGEVILRLEAKEAELNYKKYQEDLDILEVQRKVYGIVYESFITEEKADAVKDLNLQEYGEYSSIAQAIILENELFLSKWNALGNQEERKNAKQEELLSLLQNINTLDAKIDSVKLNLENAENVLEQYEIKAPADGQITQMNSLYEGLMIAAGESVGYLLPEGKENIFTAYVADKDVGRIKTGDAVGIKIAAYDDTSYEYMEGQAVFIGDIALNKENAGPVYRVDISFSNLPEDIKAGMEGNCDIIIGKRSVLDYFLEPFQDGLKSSLKER